LPTRLPLFSRRKEEDKAGSSLVAPRRRPNFRSAAGWRRSGGWVV